MACLRHLSLWEQRCFLSVCRSAQTGLLGLEAFRAATYIGSIAKSSSQGLSLTLTNVLKTSTSGVGRREVSWFWRSLLKAQHQCSLKESKLEASQTLWNYIFSKTQHVIFKLMAWKGFSHMGIHWGVSPRGETLCHLCK